MLQYMESDLNKEKARIDKTKIFESMKVSKALTIMALPTVLSQVIILAYNLADTYFIGTTNNPYMIGATSLVLALYLMLVVIANLFGVGGGNLMVRLLGQKDIEEAKKVASFTMMWSAISALVFSLLCLALMNPLLRLFGASDEVIGYAKEYMLFTVVIGGVPTVLAMALPMLIRNVGYAKEAGFGVALGALLNIGLDPLFMFVIFPAGKEVVAAGIATLVSNIIATIYFIVAIIVLRNKTILAIPHKFGKLSSTSLKSFFFVGVPAGLIMLLFNILGVVLNRLAAQYSDLVLASTGILLKVERLPQNIALGVCLGMVPCVGYNYARKDYKRMDKFFTSSLIVTQVIAVISTILFYFLAEQIMSIFINDEEIIKVGSKFIKARCFSIPFMVFGFQVINYMQAINHGKISLLLTIIRHLVLSIPLMLIMNRALGIDGLIWSQTIADVINAFISIFFYFLIRKRITLIGSNT